MTLKHITGAALLSTALLAATSGCTTTVSGPTGTCAPDPTVNGCVNADGFSCTGTDRPEDTNASLFCSDGVPGNAGSTLYCCVTLTISTCAPDYTVTGCASGSIGFSCTGADSPDMGNPNLVCSVGVPGNAGSTLYCCVP
jgi:hypothetical protein